MNSEWLLAANWMGIDSTTLPIHLWTICTAAIGNAACALVGCYLVLRRMSLLGDAISHSILAAIGVVFLLTGSASFVPIFIGATITGVLTGFLTQSLTDAADVPEDTSMGVVFTSLFAFGVVIVSQFPQHDLDVNCVLFGKVEFVSLQTIPIRGFDIPEAFLRLSGVLLLTVIFVCVLWKELKLASFDALLATSMGFSAGKIHYLLLAVVAVVTVTSLESMGAIVAIAMLIVPGATAHLLTDRLRTMLPLSVVVSTLATIAGYVAAVRVNATVSGMVAVAAGVLFAFAVILAPQHGLLGRLANTLRLRLRIAEEDILGRLYRLQETRAAAGRETPTLSRHQCLQIAGGSWIGSLALWHLNRGGHIASAGDRHVQLTDSGRQLGQSILRAHRLWEAYINEHFELQEDHLHEPAHRVEHFIGPTLQDRLQAELADAAATDPHGQRIPPRPDSSNPDTRRSP